MSYLKKRKTAFGYAFSGLGQALKREPHFRIHLVAAVVAVAGGFYFSISTPEWLALAGCIASVVSLELINSALEKLCDLVQPEQHPAVKYIKDVSAAAVLVACLFSIVVGVLVFWKYFF